jgi:sugar lactone lactonase YvrE
MGARQRFVFGVLLVSVVSLLGPTRLWADTVTVAGGNGAGSAANQLGMSLDVAVDAAGNIYVADADNHRVQRWAPGASAGVTVAGGNGAGSGANQLWRPSGVAVDAAANVYVADLGNHRVQRWAPGASGGVTVAGGNGAGSAANQLSYPSGVAVDAVGNIYVPDGFDIGMGMANHRVQRWAPAVAEGVTVAGGNGGGSAANQLGMPLGVAVDAADNIYVADADNHRIQRWAPGAAEGVTVAGGNGAGSGANQLSEPHDVAVDAGGNIYIADWGNARVQRWAPGATEGVTMVASSGGGFVAPGPPLFPSGVAVDALGRIFVADPALVLRVVLEVPAITGTNPVFVVAEPGVGHATVANPVRVTGTPVPTNTYNGGEWPATFPVGTTTVNIEAVNIVGTATAAVTITVTDQLPATGSDRTIVPLTATALLVAGFGLHRLARRTQHEARPGCAVSTPQHRPRLPS